jgi:hypothetical protein
MRQGCLLPLLRQSADGCDGGSRAEPPFDRARSSIDSPLDANRRSHPSRPRPRIGPTLPRDVRAVPKHDQGGPSAMSLRYGATGAAKR